MGLIELLIVLLVIVLLAQLLLSFIPGLDRRIVGLLVVLIVLSYFFGSHGHIRLWR